MSFLYDVKSGKVVKSKLYNNDLLLKDALSFNPLTLFKDGKQGVWYDPSDKSTLYQDAEGTVPVTAIGDPIGLMLDKSGNGNHARQTISAYRPTLALDANGRTCIRSREGGYMMMPSPFTFIADGTGATLLMAFGAWVSDFIAAVIGNDSVTIANTGFDIYLDNRDTSKPQMLNHSNPRDGLTNTSLVSNMISATAPNILKYQQTPTLNRWGTNHKAFVEAPMTTNINTTDNMAIMGASGANGVRHATLTPDFYGMVLIDEPLDSETLAKVENHFLTKAGGI